jgi:hypothetical protein
MKELKKSYGNYGSQAYNAPGIDFNQQRDYGRKQS